MTSDEVESIRDMASIVVLFQESYLVLILQKAIQCGEATPNCVPYVHLGEFELEPNRLFIKSFDDSLPQWVSCNDYII